ncbi:MAG TPA: Sec-independent protein translocase protein TatB [Pseudomonadales bacterium]|nr:Sec-independent protein translocase protein TatB [Pseudomonadales bacterium]
MFDIGFPELLLVSIVALLVFGPERLPEVLRTVGGWLGSARRSFATLKSEIEREVGADEIRRDIHNSRIMEEAKQLERQVAASRDEVEEILGKRYAALKKEDSNAAATNEDATPGTDDDDTAALPGAKASAAPEVDDGTDGAAAAPSGDDARRRDAGADGSEGAQHQPGAADDDRGKGRT